MAKNAAISQWIGGEGMVSYPSMAAFENDI